MSSFAKRMKYSLGRVDFISCLRYEDDMTESTEEKQQRISVTITWIDPSIASIENPRIAEFQREQTFEDKGKATRFARNLLKKGLAWGPTVEMELIDRKGKNAPEFWSYSVWDISLNGHEGKYTHALNQIRQSPPKKKLSRSPMYLAVLARDEHDVVF